MDGAEKAFRAAIEADPGNAMADPRFACAHHNLGVLLQNERQDVDGAEKAFRAAIEADPRLTLAHRNLDVLLREEWQ